MTGLRAEDGFTLIETMVAIALFSVVAAGFYSVMFSGVGGADTARSIVRVSEEARLGLNRIVRDTRELDQLIAPTAASYRIQVDFDGNGTIYSPPCQANGELGYEDVSYAYDAANNDITLCGTVLIGGVTPIPGEDVFTYSSNHLELDANNDGVTSAAEVDAAPGIGNSNGALDLLAEIDVISTVSFAFQVSEGDEIARFRSQAQLRNQR